MDKTISIGKVNIDLSHYSGQDLYSEGEIEDRLLKVSEENDSSSFKKIVEDSDEWAYLYHLSDIRENIVSWLPIKKSDKVLEVGAGMGAICGALCKLASEVTTVDLSLKRSTINANRHKDCGNLSMKIGNFTDIEPELPNDYDWIFLIGVFEYAISYIPTDHPFEDFLKILKKHLKHDGRIVIAIENRLGLKYFAGCKEDHTCGFFDGIEDYKKGGQVRTFSKAGLEKIFNEVDITDYNFYYPYPDYKLPNTIFSDERLPKIGELKDNIRNFDQDRLLLFDETSAYDGLIKDGMFPVFSNSFMVVSGPKLSVDYAKYSMDRDDEFCIVTSICEGVTGKTVVKKALYESGRKHIADIKKAYDELSKRFEGSELNINSVLEYDENEGRIVFDYIEGRTLEELLDECVLNSDEEGFKKLFDKYKSLVSYNSEYGVIDDDLIFSNILVNEKGWYLIDYEWVRFEAGKSEDVIARAIINYLLPDNFRNRIREWIDCDVRYDEQAFMQRVLNHNKGMSDIRHNIGKGVYNLDYLTDRVAALDIKVQVYEDFGEGFKEENSYYLVDIKKHGPNLILNIPIKEGVKNLRVDPGDKPVRFYVNRITLNDQDVTDKMLGALKNGCLDIRSCIQKNNSFIFRKEDPHVKFPVKGLDAKAGDILKIDCRAEYIY